MLKKIEYFCKVDGSMQPAMCQPAAGEEPRPLMVALHTWSFTVDADCSMYTSVAEKYNWHMIFPHFRGQNWQPEACGSDLVVSDLEDAVAYMCSTYNVDPSRIYLVGGSGGGHCSLLMAARRPDLWTAVSAWCPISDVALWHKQSSLRRNGYANHISNACGGDPALSASANMSARLRSPLTWLPNAVDKVTVDISTGIHDGHTGSVPIGQAVRAFNALAEEKDRISEEDIAYMEENEKVPEHLAAKEGDPAFGKYTVYFRRQSKRVRLTLFEGGHDILPAVSAEWLNRQVSGAEPDWSTGKAIESVASELSK